MQSLMKTHVVLSPANIEIEYRLAGAGSRLAAFLIDFLIQIVAIVAITALVLVGVYGYRFGALADVSGFILGFLIISWFVIYFCYFIILEMLMNGQSVGKKLFGLRVIRDNGQPIGLSQSMIRNFFKSLFDIFYIGLFVIMFSSKHKRIGDIVAGTIVVAEHYGNIGVPLRPRTEAQAQNYIPAEFAHIILDEEERKQLQAYLSRKRYLDDGGEALSKKWAEYFSAKWQMPLYQINDTILSALIQKKYEVQNLE